MVKTRILKYFFFLLLGALFVSCEKVVILDLNTAESNIVIEGNITTKEGLPQTVFVSTSGDFYTGDGVGPVGDATVKLNDTLGNSVTLEMYTPGVYFTYDLNPMPNYNYTIEVTRQGEVYTGSEIFPTKKLIDSLSYSINNGLFGDGGLNENGDSTYNIFCRFQDPLEDLDYYRIVIHINDSLISAGFGTYLVFDDELFNGQLYNFEILGTGATKGDTVEVDFQSIGAYTHQYYVGLNDVLNSGTGSTPYNPISNLNNEALGYFGAYTSDSQTIIIE